MKDIVCGMEVEPSSPFSQEYNNKTYFFFSDACQQKFEEHPHQYIKTSTTSCSRDKGEQNEACDVSFQVERNESSLRATNIPVPCTPKLLEI